ncbi:MAG: hypothetical protein ACRDON_10615 [Gaiellaceae bacterium]
MNKPATDNWDDAGWGASVEEPLRGVSAASVPSLVTEVRPDARTLPEFRVIACWTVVLGAGLSVWTGAIYGLLRLLSEPFS